MREEQVVIAIGAMITSVFILKIIMGAITRVICHWCDSSLKMRLVESGMSAAEIEQVIAAGKRRARPKTKKLSKPATDDYSFVN